MYTYGYVNMCSLGGELRVGIAHVDELITLIGAEVKMNVYLCRLRPWGQDGRTQSKLIGGEVHHIRSVLSSLLRSRWFMIG